MGNLLMGTCPDGSSCCLPPRSTIVLIALLGMAACVTDAMTAEACSDVDCPMRDYVESSRVVLLTLFQFANVLLLLAAIIENAFLVELYVWYALAFVVLGFIVNIMDLLCRINDGRRRLNWSVFVPEVAFLFVLYKCIDIVDAYKKLLEGQIRIH